MKKTLSVFLVSLIGITFIVGVANAALCDDSQNGTVGLVPCGVRVNPPANPTVSQTPTLACRCELGHVFLLGRNLYNFALLYIATPLAVLGILIGGLYLLTSAGNPGQVQKGWNIIKWTCLAILLIFGSWLIIDIILKAIGYQGVWNTFNF